jgi:hypothetical protein
MSRRCRYLHAVCSLPARDTIATALRVARNLRAPYDQHDRDGAAIYSLAGCYHVAIDLLRGSNIALDLTAVRRKPTKMLGCRQSYHGATMLLAGRDTVAICGQAFGRRAGGVFERPQNDGCRMSDRRSSRVARRRHGERCCSNRRQKKRGDRSRPGPPHSSQSGLSLRARLPVRGVGEGNPFLSISALIAARSASQTWVRACV